MSKLSEEETKHFEKIKEIETWLQRSTSLPADVRVETAIEVYTSIRSFIDSKSEPEPIQPNYDMYIEEWICPNCGTKTQEECTYMKGK